MLNKKKVDDKKMTTELITNSCSQHFSASSTIRSDDLEDEELKEIVSSVSHRHFPVINHQTPSPLNLRSIEIPATVKEDKLSKLISRLKNADYLDSFLDKVESEYRYNNMNPDYQEVRFIFDKIYYWPQKIKLEELGCFLSVRTLFSLPTNQRLAHSQDTLVLLDPNQIQKKNLSNLLKASHSKSFVDEIEKLLNLPLIPVSLSSFGIANNSIANFFAKHANQDVIFQKTIKLNQESYLFGIADGHGQCLDEAQPVAEFIAEHLQTVLECLYKTFSFLCSDEVAIYNALKLCGVYLDSYYNEIFPKNLHNGSCVCFCLATPTLTYFINIGDSRIVLLDPNGESIPVTLDATGKEQDFRLSVLKRNGMIVECNGVDRVNGCLMPFRSIGDSYLRQPIEDTVSGMNPLGTRSKVTYVPTEWIQQTKKKILIASDGITGIFSNHDLNNILKDNIKETDSFFCDEIINLLCQMAYHDLLREEIDLILSSKVVFNEILKSPNLIHQIFNKIHDIYPVFTKIWPPLSYQEKVSYLQKVSSEEVDGFRDDDCSCMLASFSNQQSHINLSNENCPLNEQKK
jgi:serine/threonine protein phosphatase PrpC